MIPSNLSKAVHITWICAFVVYISRLRTLRFMIWKNCTITNSKLLLCPPSKEFMPLCYLHTPLFFFSSAQLLPYPPTASFLNLGRINQPVWKFHPQHHSRLLNRWYQHMQCSTDYRSSKLTSNCVSDCRESVAETSFVHHDGHISPDKRRGRVARISSLIVDPPILWHRTFVHRDFVCWMIKGISE